MKPFKILLRKQAVTLIEVLFVILIVSVLLVTASLAFRGSFDAWQSSMRRTELVQMGRVAIDKITREILTAHNFGGSCDANNIFYTAQDGKYYQFQIDTANGVLRFGEVGVSLNDLITPIESGSAFVYYKEDGVTTTVKPSEIRSVRVTLVVSDAEGLVGSVTVSSRIKWRMGGDKNRSWPMYAKDEENSGVTYEILNPNYLVDRWTSVDLGCQFNGSSPIVRDGRVYIGCSDQRRLYALDAEDGSVIGSIGGADGNIVSTPVADENYVYIAAGRRAYALDKNTGNLVWQVSGSQAFDGNIDHSSPVLYGGSLYVAADQYIYRLKASTGERIWRSVKLNGDVDFSSPAISGGKIYIAAGPTLHALNLSDGTDAWGGGSSGGSGDIQYVESSRIDQRRQLKFDIINTASSAIGITSLTIEYPGTFFYRTIRWNGNRVWRGLSSSGVLTTLDTPMSINAGETVHMTIVFTARVAPYEFTITFNDGSVLVIPPVSSGGGDEFQSSPTVFNGVVYTGNDDRHIYAYNAEDGRLLWQSGRLAGKARGSLAVSPGGHFVYAGAGQRVYKLTMLDGKGMWRSPNLDGNIVSAIVLSGNYLYVSAGHYLYALDEARGHVVWQSSRLRGNTGYSSPAIVNGMIYVGTSRRRMYAYGLQ